MPIRHRVQPAQARRADRAGGAGGTTHEMRNQPYAAC
jgi:hypothetical protein